MLERALAIFEAAVGAEHPDSRACRQNLDALLEE